MNRKGFISSVSSLATVPIIGLRNFASTWEENHPTAIIPPYLQSGDTIGITSPAGYITYDEIKPAISQMQSWGFAVKIGETIGKRDFTFGGTDEERARDFQRQLDDVEIGMIANRDGQYLRNALLDQMGSETAISAGQRYFLHVYNLAEDDQSFGIRKDASATRGDITITATMDLIDTTTNTVVLTRPLRTRAGYNRMDNLYGAQISKQDTIDRLLDEMANRAVTELTLYFDRKG